ncbi:hypothetical protein AMAG_13430 [Allomyces macrogynus ATCC 38327]|uniref:Radical SAM core domain-containing protein n=1 Tax=Allomyces macrogynus (strain ATCC 38327) TaxID=578462 RepID=A0A0L0T2H7_ALLM3|nr:hypothetical protein AMAG_13430 [Allomyces macrogynus ATCC 38327]|eukprot:KNE68789.1 hypothetical protein AMAG_13430 [Allomyces macrogynus ATCC 38327]
MLMTATMVAAATRCTRRALAYSLPRRRPYCSHGEASSAATASPPTPAPAPAADANNADGSLPLLVPFARQMYISAQLPSSPAPAPSAAGTNRRPARVDPLLGSSPAGAVDTRIEKVAFHLRDNPHHVLEVTGSRYSSSSLPHAAPDVHVSVASQIGCLHNCTYCVSSRLGGLRRNLGLEEMLAQVLYFGSAAAFRPDGPGPPESTPSGAGAVSSVALHGHGEPLDNPHTLDFLDFLRSYYAPMFGSAGTTPLPLHASPNSPAAAPAPPRTAVSTVGVLPALERLLHEFPDTAVTWTLNTPFPTQRAKLMPTVEAQHPLTSVLDLLRTHVRDHARDNVAVAYLLLRGVNDSDAHLRALANLVADGPVPVSLVHFHPVLVPAPAAEGVPRPRSRRGAPTLAGFDPTGFFEPSPPHVVEAWRAKLQDAGVPVAVQEYFEFPAVATGPPPLAAGVPTSAAC